MNLPVRRSGTGCWTVPLLAAALLAAPPPTRAAEPDAVAVQQLVAGQEAGFGLTFRLGPPRSYPFRIGSEAIVDFVLLGVARFDVILAWSDLAATGDGQLRAAGSAGDNQFVGLGDVTVSGVLPGGLSSFDDFAAQPFPEGVWLLILTQQSLTGPDVSIGIR